MSYRISESKLHKIKKYIGVMLAALVIFTTMLGSTINSKAYATPRLIVTGYDTNKDKIIAGDEFEITLHIKNTAKNTQLSNIQLQISAADNEFIPVSGSNTVYIEKIAADTEEDVVISLKAKSDLEAKPYTLDITLDYEDRYSVTFQETCKLTIPISQEMSISVTEQNITKSQVEVGAKTGISFSINNKGKNKINNVNVELTGANIEETTSYIGNIESGSTGYVDVNVVGAKEGEGKITAIITFEDSEGNVASRTEEFDIEVVAEAEPDTEIEEAVTVEKTNYMPYIIIAVIVVIIIIITVVKKRKDKEEFDEIS